LRIYIFVAVSSFDGREKTHTIL